MQQETSRNERIAYAMDFASYLIARAEGIDRVILHGSIARGDFDEKSDVDLFIDTKSKNTEKRIQKLTNDYYKTEKYKHWSLKGIISEFSLIVGALDSPEWKDLKRAMLITGIILYGKYTAASEKTHQYTLFSFEKIKPESLRVVLYRKIFGFTQGKKYYPGLAEKLHVVRIGTGSLLVPAAHVRVFLEYFRSKKIQAKLYDVWSDSDLSNDT